MAQASALVTTLTMLLAAVCVAGCGSDADKSGDISVSDVTDVPGDSLAPDHGAPFDAVDDSSLSDAIADVFVPGSVTVPYCAVDESAVDALFDGLTVRQRIGQHVITSMARSGSKLDSESDRRIRTWHFGGGFISQITGVALGENEKTASFIHDAQTVSGQSSGVPMFIATDQEGGVYSSFNRMMGGTDNIGPAAIGSTGDENVAFRQFDMMGREIRALGINMDFAPLLDTHYSRDNGNLNTRTFGPDVEMNTRLGVAAVLGLQKNLVLPTVKHFPGDGMTGGNTHHEFVVNDASRQELESMLLKPFRAAFGAGADGVMIIPAGYAAIDPERAAITSKKVISGFLRDEIGFDGLVVTDDLGMYGARMGLDESADVGLEALKAGADMLLYVSATDELLDSLFLSVETALVSESGFADQFERSTKNIIRHKMKYCLFENPTYPGSDDIKSLPLKTGLASDTAMSFRHAVEAVVVLNDRDVLPVTGKRVVCVCPEVYLPDPASGWNWLIERTFCASIQAMKPPMKTRLSGESDDSAYPPVQTFSFVVGSGESDAASGALAAAENADVIVVATFGAYFSESQQAMLESLIAGSAVPVVHVMTGVPFDYVQTAGRVDAAIALNGGLPVMFDAAVAVMYGEFVAGGHMAYDLN